MQKLLSTLLLLIACSQSFSLHAAEKQSSNNKLPSSSALQKTTLETKLLQEVEILRDQNKLIHSFQTDILTTVYWALGGVFTTFAFLAGFGWWSNFKMYEADKKRMQDDLIAKINELDAKLALRLQENRAELERVVDAKGEAQLERLTSELTELRANISNLTIESNNRIKEINDVRKNLERSTKAQEEAILTAESDLRFVEEFVWDTRNSPGNILITQRQGIDACIQSNQVLRINDILDRMNHTLQKYYIGHKEVLDKDTHDDIAETLKKLDGKNKIPANETLALLSKAKVAPED